MVETKSIDIRIVYLENNQQQIKDIAISDGSTIADALEYAQLVIPPDHGIGIFGKLRALTTRLNSGDRIEIYPPLPVDPKIARRKRAKKQLNGKLLLSKVLQNRRKNQE